MYYVNGMYFQTLREAIEDAKGLLSRNEIVYIYKRDVEFMYVECVKYNKYLVEKVR